MRCSDALPDGRKLNRSGGQDHDRPIAEVPTPGGCQAAISRWIVRTMREDLHGYAGLVAEVPSLNSFGPPI